MTRHPRSTTRLARRPLVGVALALTLVAAACGGDDDDDGSAADTEATPESPAVSASSPAEGTTADEGTSASEGTTGGDDTTAVPEASEEAVLKIGSIFSLSGAVAPFSEGGVHAVDLAIQQINDAGGFVVGDTNYTLELVELDDRSDPAVATASATQLLEDEGVNIILGPVTSVTAPAVAEYAVPRGAIMVSGSTGLVPMLTPESVDGEMKTLFNTSGDLAGIAGYMQRALETGYPEATKVAALYDDGGIGSFMGPNFSTAAEALGLDLVAEEVYPADATDFSSVLTTIKGAEPDVLFVCCTSTSNANIAKQAIELGVAPAFMSWGGSLRPATSSAIGGPIEEPWVVVNMPGIMEVLEDGTKVAPREGELQYLDDVENVLGAEISVDEGGALYFYDYVFMLVEAMKQAGTVDDTAAIAEAMETLAFDGPTMGPISYNDAHIAQISADYCKVEDGVPSCETLEHEG